MTYDVESVTRLFNALRDEYRNGRFWPEERDMIAEDITVDWDEGGCYLHVDGETWRVADPEALYDRVKAAILPWLMERDEALSAARIERAQYAEDWAREAYDLSDPKHPDFHSVHADLWDARAGK